jgi:hypothetical protein
MSETARHENRKAMQICDRCHERKARFRYRGEVRADRHHTLCFQCYRSEREHRRARELANVRPVRVRCPFREVLTHHQIDHRKAMLLFAQSQLARADKH